MDYHNDPELSDKQAWAWANSVDPDQTAPGAPRESDQGLHYSPFCLYYLDTLLYSKSPLFNF